MLQAVVTEEKDGFLFHDEIREGKQEKCTRQCDKIEYRA